MDKEFPFVIKILQLWDYERVNNKLLSVLWHTIQIWVIDVL